MYEGGVDAKKYTYYNIFIVLMFLCTFHILLLLCFYAHMFWEYPIMQSSVQDLTYIFSSTKRRWRRNKVLKICQNIYVLIVIWCFFLACNISIIFLRICNKNVESDSIFQYITFIFVLFADLVNMFMVEDLLLFVEFWIFDQQKVREILGNHLLLTNKTFKPWNDQ